MNLNFKKPLLQTKAFFETSNLESNTHDDNDDDDYDGYDHHLSSLDDSIASNSKEFDNYKDPHAYYRKKNPRISLVKALYKWWIVILELITYPNFSSQNLCVLKYVETFQIISETWFNTCFKTHVATMVVVWDLEGGCWLCGGRDAILLGILAVLVGKVCLWGTCCIGCLMPHIHNYLSIDRPLSRTMLWVPNKLTPCLTQGGQSPRPPITQMPKFVVRNRSSPEVFCHNPRLISSTTTSNPIQSQTH